jgi:anti-sigma factor ChrR (cupin superfamily)
MSPARPARRDAALEEILQERFADRTDQSDVLLQRIEALADAVPEKAAQKAAPVRLVRNEDASRR